MPNVANATHTPAHSAAFRNAHAAPSRPNDRLDPCTQFVIFTHLQAMSDPLPRDELLMVVEAFPGIGSVAKSLLERDILRAGATDPGAGGFVGLLHQRPTSSSEASLDIQW